MEPPNDCIAILVDEYLENSLKGDTFLIISGIFKTLIFDTKQSFCQFLHLFQEEDEDQFSPISFQLLREIKQKMDNFPKKSQNPKSSFLERLVCSCRSLFKFKGNKFLSSRIFLFTSKPQVQQSDEKLLRDLSIYCQRVFQSILWYLPQQYYFCQNQVKINLIAQNNENDSLQDMVQNINQNYWGFFTFEEAIKISQQTRKRRVQIRSKYSGKFEISATIFSEVLVFTKCQEQKFYSLKQQSDLAFSSEQPTIQKKVQFFPYDTLIYDDQYQITNVVKAFPYGKKLIPISNVLLKQTQYYSFREFIFLGTIKKNKLPRSCYMGGTDVVFPKHNDHKSSKLICSLSEAASQQQQVLICRFTLRQNIPPSLVALIPITKKKSNSHFCMVKIPTSESLREYPFGSLIPSTEKQKEFYSQLIDSHSLGENFKITKQENPFLSQLKNMIFERAMKKEVTQSEINKQYEDEQEGKIQSLNQSISLSTQCMSAPQEEPEGNKNEKRLFWKDILEKDLLPSKQFFRKEYNRQTSYIEELIENSKYSREKSQLAIENMKSFLENYHSTYLRNFSEKILVRVLQKWRIVCILQHFPQEFNEILESINSQGNEVLFSEISDAGITFISREEEQNSIKNASDSVEFLKDLSERIGINQNLENSIPQPENQSNQQINKADNQKSNNFWEIRTNQIDKLHTFPLHQELIKLSSNEDIDSIDSYSSNSSCSSSSLSNNQEDSPKNIVQEGSEGDDEQLQVRKKNKDNENLLLADLSLTSHQQFTRCTSQKQFESSLMKVELKYRQPQINKNIFNTENILPIDFFQCLWTQKVWELITSQTNMYVKQTKSNKNQHIFDVSDIKRMVVCEIIMGIKRLPSFTDYFSSHPLISGGLNKILSRNKYQEISCCLHLGDNMSMNTSQDDLSKVSKFINILSSNYRAAYSPSNYLAIDEGIIPFKGKSKLKVYCPDKPTKFGIKEYLLCDYSGYTLAQKIYSPSDKEETSIPLSGTRLQTQIIVNELMKTQEQVKGSILIMDNFYNSLELLDDLTQQGVGLLGTVRAERLKNLNEEQKKGMKLSELRKGETQSFLAGSAHFLLWRDRKKVVKMLTNFLDDRIVLRSMKKSGQTKSIPLMVDIYNKYAHSVDKRNQICSNYRILRRSNKWWKGVFYRLLDTTLCNAYILYKIHSEEESMKGKRLLSHKDFRMEVVTGIIKGINLSLHNQIHSNNIFTVPIHFQKLPPAQSSANSTFISHFLKFSNISRRCLICGSRTDYCCENCSLGNKVASICPSPCHKTHINQVYSIQNVKQ